MIRKFMFEELQHIDISKADVLVSNVFDKNGKERIRFVVKRIPDMFHRYDAVPYVGFVPDDRPKDILCSLNEMELNDKEQIVGFFKTYGFIFEASEKEYSDYTLEEIQEFFRYMKQLTEISNMYTKYIWNEDIELDKIKSLAADLSPLFLNKDMIANSFKGESIDKDTVKKLLSEVLDTQINHYIGKAHGAVRYIDEKHPCVIITEPENDLAVALHLEILFMIENKVICKSCNKEGCPDAGKFYFMNPVEAYQKTCVDRKCRVRMNKRNYDKNHPPK